MMYCKGSRRGGPEMGKQQWQWRDSSVVKNTYSFQRESKFRLGGSQPPAIPVPEYPMLSSGLYGHYTHMYVLTHRHIHII